MRMSKKKNRHKPVVIDLFAGVGGLSLGAARAGFDIAAAVDTDKLALEFHARNFPSTTHIDLTVRTLRGIDLLSSAGLAPGELDGLIGGPPCQGFSMIGHRSSTDPRNNLFAQFFRLVSETRPKFFVAENVPGILGAPYDQARKRALAKVSSNYVVLEPIKITASDYGAATRRTRVFFMGFRRDSIDNLSAESFRPPKIDPVYVREALRGLPIRIDAEWQTEEQGWRSLNNPKTTPYLRRIAGRIPLGVGDPKVIERLQEKSQVSGCLGTLHETKVIRRFERLEPGQQDPISKAIRLDGGGLCPTLRAGTGSDRGSYQAVRPIHYREPRVITPREAARLQGFPDWFIFHPTKWHSFRQIGNSVSPIVAEHLLRQFARALA